ncbi:MAG: oxygen-independent coproporphyrinogen III oxidase [Saprospiraceae bacterium]
MDPRLLAKYDVAAPRYTSYPTVPYWTDTQIDPKWWMNRVTDAYQADPAISLYIHLPFCERLCTYCGCNKHITKNHDLERPYLEAVLAEWKMYRSQLPGTPLLKEIHLGGGTPTFFHPDNLKWLLESILEDLEVLPNADMGFEAHPNSTTDAHLEVLRKLGFNRISIGVQDFDDALMVLVNRHQTLDEILHCTDTARELGYTSVNYDLIFGLPKQTPEHIRKDADILERVLPDRLAFYSYAHVPWLKRSQCAYSEEDLPTGAAKRLLYETGRARLEAMGYTEIGMDHFALPSDGLTKSMHGGTMHRNFMGYTPYKTQLMLGLGVSAIADSWDGFVQNAKTIKEYQELVGAGQLPLFRGHALTDEDQRIRKHILRLMTRFSTNWFDPADFDPVLEQALPRLQPMLEDGLIEIAPMEVRVTEAGRPFLRNICMAFDARYWRKQPEGRLFSQSV